MIAFLALASVAAAPVPDRPLSEYVGPADKSFIAEKYGIGGRVAVTLMVDANGRTSSCVIIKSSGHSILDASTCRILQRRARFKPATDDAGNPVQGSVSGDVDWGS